MVNTEIFLPEEIIHLIQSSMTGKEAARTSIFSKSWHSAWLTRPDLVFDQHDFMWKGLGRKAKDIFWQFVKKTTQRYDELKLRIQSFRLHILYDGGTCPRPEELIVRAMKLGATDIGFEVDDPVLYIMTFILPQEVLGSKILRRLSVRGCYIGLGKDRKARCSRLESLTLKEVVCADGDIIWDIISSCPLIENLSMSDCYFVDAVTRNRRMEPRRLRPFDKLSGSAVDGLISPFSKLKSLFVEDTPIGKSFFHDFGSKFPCLKDLSLKNCYGYKGLIQLASSSLECISFVQRITLLARFDVPCIRKFTYQGTSVPSLSFKDYSRGWKSDISLTVHRHCASWFPRLKKLLANLSQYEICLSLKILNFTDRSSDDDGRDNGLPPVAIKDLILYLEVPSSISSSFLNGLFWCCRPKFITLHLFPGKERRNHGFLDLLCKTLMHELSVVIVEAFDEGRAEWQRTPLETLLTASMSPDYEGKVRFQLT